MAVQSSETAGRRHPPLVLASTSPYRKALLARLGLAFTTDAPAVDEQALAGEIAPAMAVRLAEAKARACATRHPDALVIGSDQTVDGGGAILGKPGNLAAAREQLRAASGQWRTFHTGVCLLNTASGAAQRECVAFALKFRDLDDGEIERYLRAERPFDCAGAIKSEALGVTLLETTRGPDSSALVGLPLIALSHMLRREGVPLP